MILYCIIVYCIVRMHCNVVLDCIVALQYILAWQRNLALYCIMEYRIAILYSTAVHLLYDSADSVRRDPKRVNDGS